MTWRPKRLTRKQRTAPQETRTCEVRVSWLIEPIKKQLTSSRWQHPHASPAVLRIFYQSISALLNKLTPSRRASCPTRGCICLWLHPTKMCREGYDEGVGVGVTRLTGTMRICPAYRGENSSSSTSLASTMASTVELNLAAIPSSVSLGSTKY